MIAVWFSHPSVFVLAALGLGSLWSVVAKEGMEFSLCSVRDLSRVGGQLCSFLPGFTPSFDSRAASPELLARIGGFAPLPPRSVEQLRWYLDTPLHLFANPRRPGPYGRGCARLLLGLPRLVEEEYAEMAGADLFRSYSCSWLRAVHKYPFQGRLLLFLVPLMLLAIGEGTAAMMHINERYRG